MKKPLSASGGGGGDGRGGVGRGGGAMAPRGKLGGDGGSGEGGARGGEASWMAHTRMYIVWFSDEHQPPGSVVQVYGGGQPPQS